jgi:uncharacterized protein (DUF111 family)
VRLAYFDCPSGAAGDMILGALVDAGLGWEDLLADLARLALPGYALERREVMKGAFRATKVEVHVGGPADEHSHPHPPASHPHLRTRTARSRSSATSSRGAPCRTG